MASSHVHCYHCGRELEVVQQYDNYLDKGYDLIYVRMCEFCANKMRESYSGLLEFLPTIGEKLNV